MSVRTDGIAQTPDHVPFDPSLLDLALSGYPFMYAFVPVLLHGADATSQQVQEALRRYQ